MWRLTLSVVLLVAVTVTCSNGYFFNDYVYAQQWPAAFCTSHALKHSKESCSFPKNITAWTNHGLWPSVNETYPNFCNDSWKLTESAISGLEDDMRARWPTFDTGSTAFDFWQHEWDKHGTCAANVTMLHGPYNYFNFVLGLNTKYNILEMLAASSELIVPVAEHCYNYTQFTTATQELFDESAILGCVWDGEAKQQHIAQIEICFDKAFNLKCDPNWKGKHAGRRTRSTKKMPYVSPCRSTEQICYFPIPHAN